ncbi:MFS transporter [Desulfofundulus thermosubterraneus]|uniref:Drug resistance transporter, EmrB/QacA subfamily n=1 Tax=Desulfofundulus thermosubterraneus DSM 16057 TaxID=1121432 RepID=A0A1M6G610_9FIRM|nr:drug resistance transporter, EmrB/QacA subfamily [Desulfofundulus thermosubterraneus DSM 16057]
MDDTRDLKKYVLLAATLASFLTPFMGSAVNLAIPAIGREFHLDALMLNWIVTSYLLASSVFLLPFGRAADLYGRKKVFLAGIITYTLFSLLSGLATSGEMLILFRILHGIGGAMIFGTGVAMLTGVFPPQERGKVLGINVAAVYTGLSLGPVVGGFLTHQLGWRYIFYLNFLLGLIVVLVTVFKLKGEWRDVRGEKYDPAGAFLYTLGMAAFMYGIASANASTYARWVLALGLVLLALFIRQELRYPYPLINLNLFRNLVFAFSNLAALIHYSATFAVGFLLSLYLQVVRGLDAQTAGFILLAQPILMALLSPLAGRLSDRVEPRLLASLGMALSFAGLFLFSLINKTTPLWVIMGNLVLLGIGFALFSSPNTNAVMSAVEKRYYGVASATLGTMRLVGQALSMALVTLFFGFYLKGRAITLAASPLLLKSMHISFLLFAVLCAGGVYFSLARGEVREKEGRPAK